jgi:hypothetical protein
MDGYVNRILSAGWYPDICKSQEDYKILVKNLHPDVNNDANAIAAFAHLNDLKNSFIKGYEFYDESGRYSSNYLEHRWTGDFSLLRTSKSNYDKIVYLAKSNFNDKSFRHFMQYIPSNFEFEAEVLVYRSQKKCIPLSKAKQLLPVNGKEEHVNWIFSRIIEFVSMLESLGVTHAGINPDSIFIMPETHGIKVTSFYHVCTDKIKTINGKYKNYYPTQLFDTKDAGSYVDICLAKKTAICCLGDISGSGVRLRLDNKANQNVLDYLLTTDTDAFHSMRRWREVLDNNYIKRFVELEI